MEEKKKKNQIPLYVRNVKRILKIIWTERKPMIVVLALVTAYISVSAFVVSATNALFIDTLVRSSEGHILDPRFNFTLILLLIATALPEFFYIIQNLLQKRLYFFASEKFDMMMVQKRGEIDISQYEDAEFSNLVSRVNERGVYVISDRIYTVFFNFGSVISLIISSVIIAANSWWIFLLIIATTIPLFLVESKYGQDSWFVWGDEVNAEKRRKYFEYKSYYERIPVLTELKLFRNLSFFKNALQKLLKEFFEAQAKNERKNTIYKTLTLILSQGAIAFTIYFFALQIIDGRITIGWFTFMVASISGFQNALMGLFSSLGREQQNYLFVDDYFTFLDTPARIVKNGTAKLSEKAPEITFENISFSYPGTEKIVYKDFNLTIKPGEKLAIIGLNGAGKTTLIKLLARFYDPDEGRILIDGTDLKDIDLQSWYQKLGILFQEYAHYKVPVDEMIGLGNTEIVREQNNIAAAAQAGDAEKFIVSWKKGYEQQLGKEFSEGVEPSIGQWQKLALARVFYRDPAVWVLDEPTSSIDADAEAKIFERLEALPSHKTVILISHRFSTVRNADTICVIDEGRVREIGTHEALMARNDEYARLFNLQAKGYK